MREPIASFERQAEFKPVIDSLKSVANTLQGLPSSRIPALACELNVYLSNNDVSELRGLAQLLLSLDQDL